MTTRTAETSPLLIARVTGFLYLLIVPIAIFGNLYIPSKLIVRGDAAATANNIMASESLFRLSIVTALIDQIIIVLVVLGLYQLLKSVNKNMASLMVIFILLAVPIVMLNKVNQFAVLQLLNGADYLKVFPINQSQALAYLFIRLHNQGLNIAQIFWGLWLLPMGYLVFKSGFIPRILGVLLIIGGFGYLVESFAIFLGYTVNIAVYTGWGELLLALWLLIKGVNVKQQEKRALESA